ncbi:MAG: tRNA (N6-isopentenyl adenosine(37)-C2)-methylthiotransferase MiaB [Rickettsiales bacterium]|nr:tRNA (N6-isopentenyl adenosine(37)-C2)-methylthiotransferase MiaB [Rickettsiales bacterium]OUV99347.1 MAG: tRNA (N6-isopentenyl adenosine(37)-C2)-methylthiotransferase MiaB [Betaproteobacteria bacterium TMED156]|tara:strand:+ start:263 stop:1534 length:1272 start_codon:yes stop_codon:yes gene_type:complete
MNSYDSDRILESVHSTHKQVKSPESADIIVFNTCHIREKAAEKIYSELGKIKEIKKNNIDTKLIITGCVAQAEGKAMISRQPIIDAVIGPQMYHKFNKVIEEIKNKRVLELDFESHDKFKFLKKKRSIFYSSAYVTVQEGCDKFCSFCVVPFTRGAEASRKSYHVFDEVNYLVKNGCKEVILLGQNVNAYHGVNRDNKEVNLAKLITSLEKIKELKRISYTTSHPIDMHEELFELHGYSNKLNPYIHLPVQSGSDKILKLMNRKYTIKLYLQIIDRLRKNCSDIAFSSDFIVGYPEETRKDFQDTINLVKEVNFAQAYSFKYSSRVGTKSARSNIEDISNQEKNDRLQELQELLNSQQKKFNTNFISKNVEVLVKGRGKKPNQFRGTTKWMQVVNFELSREVKNIENIKIIKANNNSLLGEVL